MKVAHHFSGGLAFSKKRCVPADDRAPFVSLSRIRGRNYDHFYRPLRDGYSFLNANPAINSWATFIVSLAGSYCAGKIHCSVVAPRPHGHLGHARSRTARKTKSAREQCCVPVFSVPSGCRRLTFVTRLVMFSYARKDAETTSSSSVGTKTR